MRPRLYEGASYEGAAAGKSTLEKNALLLLLQLRLVAMQRLPLRLLLLLLQSRNNLPFPALPTLPPAYLVIMSGSHGQTQSGVSAQ